MKIYIVSDLHIEFAKFIPSPMSQNADLIILAGDIWKGAKGVEWARTAWPTQRIIYVAGNHEFYGSKRENVLAELKFAASQYNVDYLENDEVIIDGIRFIGCTLWTDFNLFGKKLQPYCIKEAKTYLNDFSVILEDEKIFTPNDALKLFEISYSYLKKKLINEIFHGKTIVITHHLPSMLSVSAKYKENLLSACFASNLDSLFGKAQYWIHGHAHNSSNYIVNGTKVICNPRGYSRYDRDVENTGFDPNLLINIQ